AHIDHCSGKALQLDLASYPPAGIRIGNGKRRAVVAAIRELAIYELWEDVVNGPAVRRQRIPRYRCRRSRRFEGSDTSIVRSPGPTRRNSINRPVVGQVLS